MGSTLRSGTCSLERGDPDDGGRTSPCRLGSGRLSTLLAYWVPTDRGVGTLLQDCNGSRVKDLRDSVLTTSETPCPTGVLHLRFHNPHGDSWAPRSPDGGRSDPYRPFHDSHVGSRFRGPWGANGLLREGLAPGEVTSALPATVAPTDRPDWAHGTEGG